MSLIILGAVILYVIKVWCFIRLLLWLGSLNLKQNISDAQEWMNETPTVPIRALK